MLRRILVAVVLAAVSVVLVGWAAVRLFGPTPDTVAEAPYVLVEATVGSVEQSIGLAVTARWPTRPVANNVAAGTVTSVELTGSRIVRDGDRLYSVDLRPVVAASGAVPSFRTLELGVEGPDVAQLQRLLTRLDYYSGVVDGRLESGTRAAVVAWQDALGVDDDGVVRPGDVVFVPSLPRRLALDPDMVARGAILAGGEPAVRGLPTAPVFGLSVTDTQDRLIGRTSAIRVTSPRGRTWTARVSGRIADPDGGTTLVLEGARGGPLCGAACGSIPTARASSLPAQAVVVPPTSGTVLPTSALVSAADGSAEVILDSGERRAVTVITEALGRAVVEGVDAGEVVRAGEAT